MENKEQLINKYRAEFENACDDLYYGYGYKFWRTHNNSIEDENIAKMVWKAAFNKMSANESKTKNMKKSVVKLNEEQLKKIVSESVKRVLKEFIEDDSIESARNDADKFINKEELASEFTDWVLNDSYKYRGLGGPVNALQAMHDYYYNDEEDELYRVCENFAEMKGLDVNEVFEAACMASHYYFAYNHDEEDNDEI